MNKRKTAESHEWSDSSRRFVHSKVVVSRSITLPERFREFVQREQRRAMGTVVVVVLNPLNRTLALAPMNAC